MNHMVDVELMEACGLELAERLEGTQPTKVLTVEATGLLPGMFVGKALQVCWVDAHPRIHSYPHLPPPISCPACAAARCLRAKVAADRRFRLIPDLLQVDDQSLGAGSVCLD